MDSSRRYNIILITLFVAIISGVPLIQMLVEIKRDGRAQFTDLFRNGDVFLGGLLGGMGQVVSFFNSLSCFFYQLVFYLALRL